MTTKTHRPLWQVAQDIRANWPNVNFAAKPYLDAMGNMDSIQDKYGYDDGRGIVLYFLNNAGTFRGDHAKRLKAELKEMLK